MRTRTQRFISALLAVAMMFVMLPVGAVSAFAESSTITLDDLVFVNGQPVNKEDNTQTKGNGWKVVPDPLYPRSNVLQLTDKADYSLSGIDYQILVMNDAEAPDTAGSISGTLSQSITVVGGSIENGSFLGEVTLCVGSVIRDGTFEEEVDLRSNEYYTEDENRSTYTRSGFNKIYGGQFKKGVVSNYYGGPHGNEHAYLTNIYGGTFCASSGNSSDFVDWGAGRYPHIYGGVFEAVAAYYLNGSARPNMGYPKIDFYTLTAQNCTINDIITSGSAVIVPNTLIDENHVDTKVTLTYTGEGTVNGWNVSYGDTIDQPIANWAGSTTSFSADNKTVTFTAPAGTEDVTVTPVTAPVKTTKTIKIPDGVKAYVSDDTFYDKVEILGEAPNQYIEVNPNTTVKLEIANPKAYENYLWYVDGNSTPVGEGTDYTFPVGSDVDKEKTITYAVDSEFIKKVTYIPDGVTVALADAEENEPFTENDIAVKTDAEGKCYVEAPVTAKLVLTVSQPQKNYRYTWKNSADADETVTNGTSFEFIVSTNDNAKITLTATQTATDLTPVSPVAAVYRVEHYKEQANGNYDVVEDDTELLVGKINETVEATAKKYAGYTLDAEKSVTSGTVFAPISNGEGVSPTILTLKLYYKMVKSPLILDGANIISVKDTNGNEFDLDDIKNADGSYNIPEGAIVTIEPANKAALADSGSVFDHWDITGGTLYKEDKQTEVNPKDERLTFVMPSTTEMVSIKLMTRDATIDEGPDLLGVAVITGTAVVGGAILAWQGYQLSTELYLKTVLPDWAVIPNNRLELAALLWRDAGQPAPESQTLYSDIDANDADAQNAARWAVENELISLPDEDVPNTFQPYTHISRIAVIKAWNKAQEMKY